MKLNKLIVAVHQVNSSFMWNKGLVAEMSTVKGGTTMALVHSFIKRDDVAVTGRIYMCVNLNLDSFPRLNWMLFISTFS